MNELLFEDTLNYASESFPQPRPFQSTAHDMLRDGVKSGHKNQMVMAPTGAGKLYLGLRICHEALARGKKAVFVCDRTTLINQASAKADEYGLSAHGILQADNPRANRYMPFQIASAQTLARREWPDADVIVIDEAHTQLKAWTEHIPTCRARVIGLSATPFSAGLGKLFSNLINATTADELTTSGVLVPMRVLSSTRPDMAGAETAGGEWTDTAAASRGMEIVGDVVSEWHAHASGRKTICFGATIAHCEEIAKQFNASGVKAAVFSSRTPDHERAALLKEFRKPNSVIRILVSVEALAKGFDVQDITCICDCRPLRKSMSTAMQMWGRGLRSCPETGKSDCVARETLILTDQGEVKIEHVTLDHKVWDGVSFVDHCGAVCRGVRPVISYDGLTATPDHEVMTDDGWTRIEDAARRKQRIIVTGISGTPIRFGADSLSKGRRQRRKVKGRSKVSSLFSLLVGFCQQYLEQTGNSSVPKLQWAQARNCSKMAVPSMPRMASALHEYALVILRTIRSAGRTVSFPWRERGGGVGGGLTWDHGSQLATGQNRQQRPLRTRKHSLVFSGCEHEQHPSIWRKAEIHFFSEKSPRSDVCRQYAQQNDFENDGRRNSGDVESGVAQTEREVWDILDAGPLQRFTANNLIVHNCAWVIDHAGAVDELGFADDPQPWSLDGKSKIQDRKAAEKKEPKTIECRQCHRVIKPAKVCPGCGHDMSGLASKAIEAHQAELQEIDRKTREAKPKAITMRDKQAWWSGFLHIARDRGKSHKWVLAQYKSKFGVWPRGLTDTPLPPMPELVSWEHSQRIRWAKGCQGAGR